MAKMEDLFSHSNVDGDELNIDEMVEEFRSDKPSHEVKIVPPVTTGTADALTAIPKMHKTPRRPSPVEDAPASADDAASLEDEVRVGGEPLKKDGNAPVKRNGFMRFWGVIVPHVGDNAFDVIRKCVMIVAILVFLGAATYLVDDLVLIPMQNTVLASSLQNQYSPDAEPDLTADEKNFAYPDGIDDAFKKLYYQNNDIRGWLSFHSPDGVTLNIDYPVMQSTDNDFYLYHDFHRTYNKNGALFFDYRNDFSNKNYFNHSAIIYGHNMASGQMFAGLNNLLNGLDYAKQATTFTMNTLYKKADYKVFAVMVVNNDPADGAPFNYLQTDFADNVEFATFLSQVQARSLYVYGDVDLLPTDEIVVLSTCSEYGDVYFNDGRTVVVARKVRNGENATTDVNQISYNDDVIMPYAWYTNQGRTPHAYYLDANYVVQPIDSLMSYIATSTNATGSNSSSTTFTLWYDGTSFGRLSSVTATTTTTMMTVPSSYTFSSYNNVITTAPTASATSPYITGIYISGSSRTNYTVGDNFDYSGTYVYAIYSDGSQKQLTTRYCAVTGFGSSSPGTYGVTVHYGTMRDTFFVYVAAAPTTTTRPTMPPTDPITVPTTMTTQSVDETTQPVV